jgi:nitrogen regulatory protein PII
MHFKLIIALVDDDKTEDVLRAARQTGATGATVIGNARGEGLREKKTFLGLELALQRDVLLFLVEKRLTRHILETIEKVGEFDSTSGTGIAFQLDVEDAVGVKHQVRHLLEESEGATT